MVTAVQSEAMQTLADPDQSVFSA